jgi:signal transduction histidine kinase
MPTKQQPDSQPGRYYSRYALVILLLVGVILAWQAWTSTRDFHDYHRSLAENSVTGTADELELLLNELQRSMRLFADEHNDLFKEINSNQDNEAAWLLLENGVTQYFPEHFGMILTGADGEVLRPDFDNKVGEVCQQDIHAFIEDNYDLQGYIHPNPQGYHFDIMVPWGEDGAPQGVFFLSFPSDILARILRRIQSPGHALMLLHSDKGGLIEVTGDGSRIQLSRDFMLAVDEQARILAQQPIKSSHWELVDIAEQGLFRAELVRNAGYSAVIFIAFTAIGLFMLQQLRRMEAQRQRAEDQALRHQTDLAHIDRINTMGEMASSLAHELNQPLAAISTYCQAGLRIIENNEDKPEKLAHALEHASIQSQRAGQIIRQMRQLASKGVVRREPVDVNRVIHDSVNLVREELKRKNISLTLDLESDLPEAVADETQIEQVILNLLRNAIEAMFYDSDNAHRLLISSHRTDPTSIQVTINDTGPGMDKEMLDRIFDTFYTTRKEGMGLGLSISRTIIEAHGGQLTAHSAPGTGSTFFFTLNRTTT